MKQNYKALVWCFALSLAKPIITTAQVDVQDSLALVALYNSTGGPNWQHHDNWLTMKPVKDWYGIRLNTANRVARIVLHVNNLVGSIPLGFCNLTSLNYLDLNHNQLTDSIPPEFGKLKGLSHLDLGNNELSGSIPPELGKITDIDDFLLNNNQLSGSIPPELGNMWRLFNLMLNNNQLTGSIPPELGKLTNLYHFDLSQNQISGSIPPELGNMGNLHNFYLNNNQLSGSIPPELGKLTSLYYLFLNNNQLSGSIPPELGKLTSLLYLFLNNNQLSGSIPSELGILAKLGSSGLFDLSHNQLTGRIPTELANLTGLYELDLDSNQLTGRIPPELGKLINLTTLNLGSNKLRDSIPSSLGNLTNLAMLDLSQNHGLSSVVPASFSNLKQLKKLVLNHDGLIGPLPAFLNTLPALNTLEILNNYFNFDGTEALVQHNFELFRYRSQRKINIHQTNNALSVYAGGTLSNNTYKWFKDGALIATIVGDSTYTPTSSGAYTVQVTNSIATKLTLYSDAVIVSALTASKQKNIAAIQTSDKNSFSIYPNPAKTSTTIAFNATGNYTVKLTDANGTVLQIRTGTAINNKNMLQLNVGKYAPGVYFVTVSNAQNETQTLRLNKQ